MTTKQEIIKFCLTLPNVYEDYPFHDDNWCVIRNGGIFGEVHLHL